MIAVDGVPAGGVAPISRRVMNLSHFLRQAHRRYPEELGLIWGDQSWTWAELDRRVDALSHALAKAGIAKGDRILLQARNSSQLVETMFACFRTGAVWVPANHRQTPDEIASLALTSGARMMICEKDFADHAARSKMLCPDLKTIWSIGPSGFGPSIETLIDGGRIGEYPAVAVQYDDPCWFFCTSGTTGRPKAAVLTHGQMAFIVNNHLCDLMPGIGHDTDASLVVAPLSHGAGIHLLVQVARGVRSILQPGDRLDVEEVWQLIERWRVTNMFTVPAIVKILTEHPAIDRYDHSSLRHVIYAGEPIYREDQKHALKKLGKVLVQYFGLGEVTGAISVLPASLHETDDMAHRIGTCGYERTGIEISIQDEDGQILAEGETGEICVCGPAVFAGYYNNVSANGESFRDGWFRTGDLGHLDAQGFLYITGRASDMYISGGSNIHPREIEEKLLAHPAIAEAVVLGVPDSKWGEVGVAVLVLRSGHQLDEQELLAWLDGKVARYKLPRRIFFSGSLPKNGYGKMAKRIVREQLEAAGELPLPVRPA